MTAEFDIELVVDVAASVPINADDDVAAQYQPLVVRVVVIVFAAVVGAVVKGIAEDVGVVVDCCCKKGSLTVGVFEWEMKMTGRQWEA